MGWNMTIATTKVLLLLACVGHIALWHCDWIITYLDGGRFGFKDLQDNARLVPLRIVGTGNIANAIMFLGLAVLI